MAWICVDFQSLNYRDRPQRNVRLGIEGQLDTHTICITIIWTDSNNQKKTQLQLFFAIKAQVYFGLTWTRRTACCASAVMGFWSAVHGLSYSSTVNRSKDELPPNATHATNETQRPCVLFDAAHACDARQGQKVRCLLLRCACFVGREPIGGGTGGGHGPPTFSLQGPCCFNPLPQLKTPSAVYAWTVNEAWV